MKKRKSQNKRRNMRNINKSETFCQVWWHKPVISATQEAESGGLQTQGL